MDWSKCVTVISDQSIKGGPFAQILEKRGAIPAESPHDDRR